jgi:hypothetical protein
VLKSVSSVSTCESHWSGAARLPLLRVRIGLQATQMSTRRNVPLRMTKLKPGAEAVGRSRVSAVDESGQLSGPNADFECGSAASNLSWMTLNRCAH